MGMMESVLSVFYYYPFPFEHRCLQRHCGIAAESPRTCRRATQNGLSVALEDGLGLGTGGSGARTPSRLAA